jgi:hypothetical protein
MCKESRDLIKELRTAINLCGQNSERKTLDDAEVMQLWFKLLDTFLVFQRKLRYGYVYNQPLPERADRAEGEKKKKRKDDDESGESESDDEVDEINEIKDEIVEVTNEIQQLEKNLNDIKDQKPPDEEQIEKVSNKLKKKKDHIVTLQLSLRELEENERRAKQAEEERNNDVNAPHNIHKLVNLWLQRDNAHCIRIVLGDLMRYVDIPTILDKIVDEHETDQFGHVKITLMRMLDSFSYKCMLLNTASELISYDTFTLGHLYHETRTRGIKPRDGMKCQRCSFALSKRADDDNSSNETSVRLFPCGHAYHTLCVGFNTVACPLCIPMESKELKQLAKTNPTLKLENRGLLQKIPTFSSDGKIKQWDRVNNKLDRKPGYQLFTEITDNKDKKKNVADAHMDRVGMLLGTAPIQLTVSTGLGKDEKLLKLKPPSLYDADDDTRSQGSATAEKVVIPKEEKTEPEAATGDTTPRKKRGRGIISNVSLTRKAIDICDFQEIVDNLI